MSSPLQALASIIEGLEAKSILLCSRESENPPPGLDTLCRELDCALHSPSGKTTEETLSSLQPRYDLIIVADCLEHLGRSEGERLLGRLRNQHSNHLAVIYRPFSTEENEREKALGEWRPEHFFAFAMRHYGSFTNTQSEQLELYTYAIESYTQKRDWNNARYWANPENFGRYWW